MDKKKLLKDGLLGEVLLEFNTCEREEDFAYSQKVNN